MGGPPLMSRFSTTQYAVGNRDKATRHFLLDLGVCMGFFQQKKTNFITIGATWTKYKNLTKEEIGN